MMTNNLLTLKFACEIIVDRDWKAIVSTYQILILPNPPKANNIYMLRRFAILASWAKSRYKGFHSQTV